MTWYDSLVGLNGSTAPNSSPTGLSTPVDTSGGNSNTSGSTLGGILSGLSGLGTSAAQAYQTIFGTSAQQSAAQAQQRQASTLQKLLPILILGGLAIGGIVLFSAFRRH